MGFIDSSDLQFTCGYYLMMICLLAIFFCILIMVLNITNHYSYAKIRYAFFTALSKKGYKGLAKQVLQNDE